MQNLDRFCFQLSPKYQNGLIDFHYTEIIIPMSKTSIKDACRRSMLKNRLASSIYMNKKGGKGNAYHAL